MFRQIVHSHYLKMSEVRKSKTPTKDVLLFVKNQLLLPPQNPLNLNLNIDL